MPRGPNMPSIARELAPAHLQPSATPVVSSPTTVARVAPKASLGLPTTDTLGPLPARAVAAHADARGLSMLTPISRAEAQALLPPGLELAAIDGVPADEHLLWVDFSEIKNGRSAVLGVDHREISGGAGAAWGAALGVGFGLAAGTLSLGLLSPVTTYLGGKWGAKLGRAAGEAGSDAVARTFGTYEEVLVTIPNVRRAGGTERYNFVLGMRLNSFWGRALEKVVGYGYNKVAGDCAVRPFEDYAVRDARGRALFRARVAPGGEGEAWTKPTEAPAFEAFRKLTSQPFLGAVGDGRFAVSRLDRAHDGDSARVRRVRGEVSAAGADFVPGVPARASALPHGGASPAGAFVFDGVHERLSWPKAVSYAEL